MISIIICGLKIYRIFCNYLFYIQGYDSLIDQTFYYLGNFMGNNKIKTKNTI
jgi:hypothetical protein